MPVSYLTNQRLLPLLYTFHFSFPSAIAEVFVSEVHSGKQTRTAKLIIPPKVPKHSHVALPYSRVFFLLTASRYTWLWQQHELYH